MQTTNEDATKENGMTPEREQALRFVEMAMQNLALAPARIATGGLPDFEGVRTHLRYAERRLRMLPEARATRVVTTLVTLVEDPDVRAILAQKKHLAADVEDALASFNV